MTTHSLLSTITLVSAGLAAVILVWYLLRRPVLTGQVKVLLLFGIGILPVTAAMTGNVVGLQTTQTRRFCGECHVMQPWTYDVQNDKSQSLASQHSRNAMFGDESCYTCHANYEMYGTIATKINGMHHVWAYYVGGGKDLSAHEATQKLSLYEPFPNSTCMHCHSTEVKGWLEHRDHRGVARELREGSVSCLGEGCHGPAHPFATGGKPKEATP